MSAEKDDLELKKPELETLAELLDSRTTQDDDEQGPYEPEFLSSSDFQDADELLWRYASEMVKITLDKMKDDLNP